MFWTHLLLSYSNFFYIDDIVFKYKADISDNPGVNATTGMHLCMLYRYTMLCGRPPFETSSLKETYDRIASNQYIVPDCISSQAASLIARMLSHNPNDRPSLDAILRHEFFRSGYMPSSLATTCCYTQPKFPAFDPPRFSDVYIYLLYLTYC